MNLLDHALLRARVLSHVRHALMAALGSAAIAIPTASAQQQARAGQAAPTLVVFITVDQMRADYFERFLPQLTGGLGRLYHGGAVYLDAHQDHAITETAPGHSVTMSGRFPSHTGIVFNARGVGDPQAPLIGGGGPGASPFRFRGSTLIDWLQAKDPRSRALSVSRKDRGAILPLGRARQSVFWYATDGRFTTSSYYADTLPTWLNEFNAKKIPETYAGKLWNPLLPLKQYPEPDTVFQENFGQGIIFPHAFPTDPAQTARLFTEFPPMDSLTAQCALAGVNAMGLGRGPQTDVLAVSFSTTDAVGHRFGPDSRELHDQIIRLDRYLAIFIDSLYKLRDSSRIAIALTADHGVAPYPELRAEREHKTAERVDVYPVLASVRARLVAAHVDTNAVQFEEGMLTLDRGALAHGGLPPDSVLTSIAAALRKVPGVGRVDLVRDLARADTARDAVARRWVHMLPSDSPAELVLSLAPYAYYQGVEMATHGTPNDYDSHVPEIFYGPWFIAGRYGKRTTVADMAPTLAAIAEVSPTEPIDGRAHLEAIRKATP
jgi:predicted AlkP superfamily pyrophosphatase or phosphodiesterase